MHAPRPRSCWRRRRTPFDAATTGRGRPAGDFAPPSHPARSSESSAQIFWASLPPSPPPIRARPAGGLRLFLPSFRRRRSAELCGLPIPQYRGLLYSAQSTFKKDLGRARQNSLATAGTNFTKPGAQNKGDLCNRPLSETPPKYTHARRKLYNMRRVIKIVTVTNSI